MSTKIRVMIVEDSRVIREFLQHIVRQDPRLELAVAVSNAEHALRLIKRLRPDVISMDIRLPGINGFEATRRIMAEWPTPIVVVSASVEAADLKISMNALRAGALAVVEKPAAMTHADYESLAERLCTQLAIMSQVKVIRQRFRPRAAERAEADDDRRLRRPSDPPSAGAFEAVGIVASTGGPKAVQTILADLPSDFALPILLVQHITASFHSGFVEWLNDICPLRVAEARGGEMPCPGNVYVAPADHHLRLAGRRLAIDQASPVSAQRPSGTVLFESMAESLGRRGCGILLTGMGQDGAVGLRALRQRGGHTIAEHASTAVVYGMPAAAVGLQAVRESLPLPAIAPRLRELALVAAAESRADRDAKFLSPAILSTP